MQFLPLQERTYPFLAYTSKTSGAAVFKISHGHLVAHTLLCRYEAISGSLMANSSMLQGGRYYHFVRDGGVGKTRAQVPNRP